MLKFAPAVSACVGLAMVGVSPVRAQAGLVDYDDAMQCSALYTYLGGVLAGDPDEAYLLDIATRWLVLAAARDGSGDGSVAFDALEPMVESLADEVDAMGDDEDAIAELFEGGMIYCEAAQAVVADEFAAADYAG